MDYLISLTPQYDAALVEAAKSAGLAPGQFAQDCVTNALGETVNSLDREATRILVLAFDAAGSAATKQQILAAADAEKAKKLVAADKLPK